MIETNAAANPTIGPRSRETSIAVIQSTTCRGSVLVVRCVSLKTMTTPITGVWAPTLTPLTENLTIDHALLAEHCRGLLADGCDGIVLFGSTGEAPSFSVAERSAALVALLDGGIAAEQIVVGTGCTAFPDTELLTEHATEAGVRGVLVIPPFFFKGVSEVGTINSYLALCDSIGDRLALYLYHFPALSMAPISAGIISSIHDRYAGNLVGLKDSSGQIASLHTFSSIDYLAVLPGTERLMLEGSRHGTGGVITATANISARLIAEVWESRIRPDVDDRQMLAVRTAIEIGTIVTMKAWLAHVSGYGGWNRVRPPLVVLADSDVTTSNDRLRQAFYSNS